MISWIHCGPSILSFTAFPLDMIAYHPFKPHSISFSNAVQVGGRIQFQRISNGDLSLAAEVGDWTVQALMENGKKLNIVHVVQGLSEGFLRPFISNVGSQNTWNIDLLAWLDGPW